MTKDEQVDLILEQLEKGLEWKDEGRGVISMRRFFAVSFKGLQHFRDTRIRLLQAGELEEVLNILEEIRNTWGDQALSSVPSKEEK